MINFEALRNRYITLDGLDGCGKTTQAKLLKDRLTLNNIPAVNLKQPNEPYRSLLIEHKIKTPEAEILVMGASREDSMPEIVNHLNHNDTVIMDRGDISMVIYQGFLHKTNVNLLPITCFYSFLASDVYILLGSSLEVRRKRIHARGAVNRLDTASLDLDIYFANFDLNILCKEEDSLRTETTGILDFDLWRNYLEKQNLSGWESYSYLHNRGHTIICVKDNDESAEVINSRITVALSEFYLSTAGR